MTGKRKNYLLQGFGVNDLDYPVSNCPFYKKWADMIRRCYSANWHAKKPSYIGTQTDDVWRFASGFKSWMEQQNWQGNHLDKDLLVKGNKIYSPETCIFVSPLVNSFLTERDLDRGEWPLGVHKYWNKFAATCNQLGGKRKFLGYFFTPEEAHQAWKEEKHRVSCLLADLQTDERVANALRSRYV